MKQLESIVASAVADPYDYAVQANAWRQLCIEYAKYAEPQTRERLNVVHALDALREKMP